MQPARSRPPTVIVRSCRARAHETQGARHARRPHLARPSRPRGRHGLLAGTSVLVTAAAGAGAGCATAKRCLEEGATVVLSAAHERRLAEAADTLGVEASPAT